MALLLSGRGRIGRSPRGPPLAKFKQELLRRHIERIVLKDAADDNHWVRPHDVDHRVAPELAQMVSADNRVFMAMPHIVYAGFKLNDIVDVRSILNCPIHTTANAAEGKSSTGVSTGQLLEYPQHSVLVEAAIG